MWALGATCLAQKLTARTVGPAEIIIPRIPLRPAERREVCDEPYVGNGKSMRHLASPYDGVSLERQCNNMLQASIGKMQHFVARLFQRLKRAVSVIRAGARDGANNVGNLAPL
jgi:hypothetical protein